MLQQTALVALVLQAASYVPSVLAHGNLIVPPPTGDSDHVYYFGGPAGTIDMPEIVGDSIYSEYYEGVDEWFTENGITSLKEYITTYSNISECGNTLKDGTAEPIPSDGYAEHDNLGNSHPGPCEIWCDDTRVFNNTNCLTEFQGESPAMIPIDVATCEASSELVFYWLALHAEPWQVYINCVALDGTTASYSSTTSSTTTDSTTTATTSTAASTADEASTAGEASTAASTTSSAATETTTTSTDAPTATSATTTTTTAPASTTEAPATTTEAPETTDAPAATTTAPSTDAPATTTSSDKCSVRRNRA